MHQLPTQLDLCTISPLIGLQADSFLLSEPANLPTTTTGGPALTVTCSSGENSFFVDFQTFFCPLANLFSAESAA